MKISKRAQALLSRHNIEPGTALAALVDFACQSSGIDRRNYFSDWRDTNGRRAFASEQKSITADFARFRDALAEAIAEGVTDADVIEEAPHSFSGRLEWVCFECGAQTGADHREGCKAKGDNLGTWNYTTGQYFPTEYRKAAATLLERAAAVVRGSRPPVVRQPQTIADLKALNRENGQHFFERDTMKFFRSKIESGIIAGNRFITSEQFNDESARKFTVRTFDTKGRIGQIGEFQAHATRAAAIAAAK